MTAMSLIADLDDGIAVHPADLAALAVAERHASADWYRRAMQLDAYQADRCVICGRPAEGGECVSCHNDVEVAVARSADV